MKAGKPSKGEKSCPMRVKKDNEGKGDGHENIIMSFRAGVTQVCLCHGNLGLMHPVPVIISFGKRMGITQPGVCRAVRRGEEFAVSENLESPDERSS